MLGFAEFSEALKEGLETRLGVTAELNEEKYINAAKTVLVVKKEGMSYGHCLHIEEAYQDYLYGTSMDEILDGLAESVKQAPPIDGVVKMMSAWENTKPRIYLRLISKERNKSLLEEAVSMDVSEEFAIIFRIHIIVSEEVKGYVTVRTSLMDHWNVSVADLYRAAQENIAREAPIVFCGMRQFSDYCLPTLDERAAADMMYVLSDTKMGDAAGAAALFLPGVMKKVAEKIGGGYIAIPSSAMEWIIIPSWACNEDADFDIADLIRKVNRECVNEEDVLGERPYYYDADKGQLRSM